MYDSNGTIEKSLDIPLCIFDLVSIVSYCAVFLCD